MTAFVSGTKGFEEFKNQKTLQDVVLADLVDVISRNTRFGCGTTVLAKDWAEANQEYRLDECHCTSYAVAAFAVINKAIRWVGRKNRQFTEFVFEEGDAGRGDFEWLVNDIIRRRPDALGPVKPRFDSKRLAPLQSADLSVWEQRNFVREKLEGTLPQKFELLRPSFQKLVTRPNDWGVLNHAEIVRWVSRTVGVPKRSEPWDRRTWRPFPASLIAPARRPTTGGADDPQT